MARPEFAQHRRRDPAPFHHVAATIREAAADEHLIQRRHRPRDRRQPPPALAGVRQRFEQVDRVRVQRTREERLRIGHFHDLARVHQRDAMRHLGDDREVVGDEQHRHLLRRLELLQQIQDLRLDRDVERGRRLVGDHDVGFRGQRDRDHHALLLPAGHLERVVADPARGLRNADALQPVDRLRFRRAAAQRRVALDHLRDLPSHGHHRVEARRRLLEDDADAVAANVAHAHFRELEDVGAFDLDGAGGDAPGVRQKPQDRQRRHRLAASRLADQRKGLAALDRERERVDRAHEAAVGVDLGGEVLDREHDVPSRWRQRPPSRHARAPGAPVSPGGPGTRVRAGRTLR